MGWIEKIFGNTSAKEIRRIEPIVREIESYDEAMQKLSDSELAAKTEEFKKRLAEGETLDDLLPEAYAVVREATGRVLHTKHFRVQLMGGIVLHQGRIAEMKTGEGKTQVARECFTAIRSFKRSLKGRSSRMRMIGSRSGFAV